MCLHDYLALFWLSGSRDFASEKRMACSFFSVVSKKAKFNFPIAARLCLAESLPHGAANVFKASSVESQRL